MHRWVRVIYRRILGFLGGGNGERKMEGRDPNTVAFSPLPLPFPQKGFFDHEKKKTTTRVVRIACLPLLRQDCESSFISSVSPLLHLTRYHIVSAFASFQIPGFVKQTFSFSPAVGASRPHAQHWRLPRTVCQRTRGSISEFI